MPGQLTELSKAIGTGADSNRDDHTISLFWPVRPRTVRIVGSTARPRRRRQSSQAPAARTAMAPDTT
jgi:hypothetical protein